MRFDLHVREKVFVFDDPLRRCYNKTFKDHHYEWGPWEILHSNIKQEKKDETLQYWKDLNAFAVKTRGESALKEFKLVEYSDEL